jgi:hypothetical protein
MRTLQNLAMEAQLDVPPLTLSLSPEYGGEGTRAGLRPDRPPYISRLRIVHCCVNGCSLPR